ncbi:MAG: amidophosphoribosyltransferase [Firmicutes bacterium]|nr:amidophosphoribosyltransferase [Bacillota bacterium]
MTKLREECGVFGIYSLKTSGIVQDTYYALFALQHRGQESCGIVVNKAGIMRSHRDLGLVNEVFAHKTLYELGQGNIAIGHVRYGTAATGNRRNAQPLTINHIKGSLALAHNGSLTNMASLRKELELAGSIFHTTSDAEVIAYHIIKQRLTSTSIEQGLLKAMAVLKGAYSLVLMSPRKLIGARDPLGIRPLCLGLRDDSYVLASESCALDAVGARFIRDIEPGEVIVIDEHGPSSYTEHCQKGSKALCVFEYIYFARPDSVLDGNSVHLARQQAGALLAKTYPVPADVVIGVPDSGIDAAIGYSKESAIPYGVGLIKNKYIGRTFIQNTQEQRNDAVRIKLNALRATLEGKRVILVDDSIVRGTTSARLVNLLREAGAKELHMRISAPPFLYPCYFGTDIDSQDKLIACKYSVEEIAQILGVDTLGYLRLEDLPNLTPNYTAGFCTACFTGQYPLDITEAKNKSWLEKPIQ